jgi:site-specific DNA-methyltransferase (adenine-specific)
MTQVERIGNATLYLGDCLAMMPALRAEACAFAVVSDPPYGIGYAHSGGERLFSKVGRTRAARERGVSAMAGDERPYDPAPWLGFCGNVLLWGADHFHRRLPASGRWLAWNKLGTLEPWDSFSDVEFAWHSGNGASRIFTLLWKGLVQAEKVANGVRHHVTQKPIALMEWCIAQSGVGGGTTVLDPYMGSGTTGVAALRLGHRFIGVEIDRRYFEIACRRSAEAQARPTLPGALQGAAL